jgi:cytochrome P450
MKTSDEYPPGPAQKVPGSLVFTYVRDPISTLVNIAQTYGDISHFRLGKNQHNYLLNHPDYIKEVLMNENRSFIKMSRLESNKKLFGEGLLNSDGDFHHHQRQLMQPAFQRDKIVNYGNIVIDCGTQISKRWNDNDNVIDIHKELMQLTLQIIIRTLFGSDDKAKYKDIVECATTVIEYFDRLAMPFGNLFGKLSLRSNQRCQSAKSQLDEIIVRTINERRGTINLDRGDLISNLLFAEDTKVEGVSRGKMTNLELRDEIMTIILAAYEPMASALTWTFYLISQYPDVEERLHAELGSVLEDGREPTIQDISKLQYTERVFTESLRLYPPAWVMFRQMVHDFPIDKYVLRAGSIVIISQYVTHHDPRFFSEPNHFDPDRWLPQAKRKIHRFSFFPFGGGPRTCLGEPFAWMEGVLLIATIIRQWKMRIEPEHLVSLEPVVPLRPKHGMPMKLTRRE